MCHRREHLAAGFINRRQAVAFANQHVSEPFVVGHKENFVISTRMSPSVDLANVPLIQLPLFGTEWVVKKPNRMYHEIQRARAHSNFFSQLQDLLQSRA